MRRSLISIQLVPFVVSRSEQKNQSSVRTVLNRGTMKTHNKRLQRTRGTVRAASVRVVALAFEAERYT